MNYLPIDEMTAEQLTTFKPYEILYCAHLFGNKHQNHKPLDGGFPYELLDTELQAIIRQADHDFALGNYVDTPEYAAFIVRINTRTTSS